MEQGEGGVCCWGACDGVGEGRGMTRGGCDVVRAGGFTTGQREGLWRGSGRRKVSCPVRKMGSAERGGGGGGGVSCLEVVFWEGKEREERETNSLSVG